MPIVSIREVKTFQEAARYDHNIRYWNIPNIAGLTERELSQSRAMIPIEILGRLWRVTAQHAPITYPLSVAEAHSDTTRVYGEWGEMMDLAENVYQRLVTGFETMSAYADDPKWELKIEGESFRLVRRWHYPNTTPRGECFAAVSELREWLIVMQRHIREPLQPLSICLPPKLFQSLEEDERKHLAGVLGVSVGEAKEVSFSFPLAALDFLSHHHDPDKFVFLQKNLAGESVRQPRRPVQKPLDIFPSELSLASKPSFDLRGGKKSDPHLLELDHRHRAALHHAALDAAAYISELGEGRKEISGIDIGGGSLAITEVFLRYLAAKTDARICLTVVDPVLKKLPELVQEKIGRMERELKIAIEIVPKPWSDFEKDLSPEKKFDFAFSCQLCSMLQTEEAFCLFRGLKRRLAKGGRAFFAFEPYDQATLPQYRHLVFYRRPLDWYRECLRQAGLSTDITTCYPAHAGEAEQIFSCLRIKASSFYTK